MSTRAPSSPATATRATSTRWSSPGSAASTACAETLGAGSYVYEPVGNVDTWSVDEDADEPCIIHIEANGRIEYLDDEDRIVTFTDAATARAAYEDWCTQTGTVPHAALTRSHG